jgi:hypothetical protein
MTVTIDATKPDVVERVVIYGSLDSVEILSVQSRVSTRSGVRIPASTRQHSIFTG